MPLASKRTPKKPREAQLHEVYPSGKSISVLLVPVDPDAEIPDAVRSIREDWSGSNLSGLYSMTAREIEHLKLGSHMRGAHIMVSAKMPPGPTSKVRTLRPGSGPRNRWINGHTRSKNRWLAFTVRPKPELGRKQGRPRRSK